MKQGYDYSEWMLISFVFWLCLTPLLLFIIVPLWGGWMGAAVAGLLLLCLLVLCWLFCLRPHR